ncbi:MAG: hypothetical protein EOP48_00480 [Sphingobacteriales bacterium]|nr:MAG: hypothetical protein EOP48_00480 [Sphingobacteriales bacterium]
MEAIESLIYSIGLIVTQDQSKVDHLQNVYHQCKSPNVQCVDSVAQTNIANVENNLTNGVNSFKAAQAAVKDIERRR